MRENLEHYSKDYKKVFLSNDCYTNEAANNMQIKKQVDLITFSQNLGIIAHFISKPFITEE